MHVLQMPGYHGQCTCTMRHGASVLGMVTNQLKVSKGVFGCDAKMVGREDSAFPLSTSK